MKKILFLIPTLDRGGAEKVLVNLVNNIDNSTFDITVLTLFSGGIKRKDLKPYIKTDCCLGKQFRGNTKVLAMFSPKFLFKRFIKEHYDIIVSYLEGPTARIVSGCTDKDTKLVSWIHVQQETTAIVCAAFRSYKEAKLCYERFDKIICVSEYVKQNFVKNFDYRRDVDVLYNTNETELIIEKSKEVVTDYDFGTEVPTIIGIGTLKKSKGFDKLIRIHKRLLDDGIKQKVIVLGVGNEENNLKDLILQLNVKDTFVLLGYNENPYKYIKNSGLFVCASIAEGFSTAATEALILGTPVCTVEVSGMKEMLGANNEYGIVTENNEDALYEGIKKILTTPGMLKEYAAKALERGKEFSTEKTTKAVEEMFEGLL